jgi:hypothetical protein
MEQIAEQIEKLDNLAHALLLPMPAAFHVEQMKSQLPRVVAALKAAYAEQFGENPWA